MDNMKRAVIITSYVEYPLDILSLIRPDDHIVCLDGGYDIARMHGVTPNVLIGDFDSIDPETAAMLEDDTDLVQILRYPPEKDQTDLELALMHLDPEKFSKLLIIGGIGGRLDQTAVNLQLLAKYTAGAVDNGQGGFRFVEMLDGRNRCFALSDSGSDCLSIPAHPDASLSLVPMSKSCEGVTLTGVKYPLEKATLLRGSSLGVSNEITADAATLSLMKGTLLVICSIL